MATARQGRVNGLELEETGRAGAQGIFPRPSPCHLLGEALP